MRTKVLQFNQSLNLGALIKASGMSGWVTMSRMSHTNLVGTSFEFNDVKNNPPPKKMPAWLMADLPQLLKFTTVPSVDIYCSAALVLKSLKWHLIVTSSVSFPGSPWDSPSLSSGCTEQQLWCNDSWKWLPTILLPPQNHNTNRKKAEKTVTRLLQHTLTCAPD